MFKSLTNSQNNQMKSKWSSQTCNRGSLSHAIIRVMKWSITVTQYSKQTQSIRSTGSENQFSDDNDVHHTSVCLWMSRSGIGKVVLAGIHSWHVLKWRPGSACIRAESEIKLSPQCVAARQPLLQPLIWTRAKPTAEKLQSLRLAHTAQVQTLEFTHTPLLNAATRHQPVPSCTSLTVWWTSKTLIQINRHEDNQIL